MPLLASLVHTGTDSPSWSTGVSKAFPPLRLQTVLCCNTQSQKLLAEMCFSYRSQDIRKRGQNADGKSINMQIN